MHDIIKKPAYAAAVLSQLILSFGCGRHMRNSSKVADASVSASSQQLVIDLGNGYSERTQSFKHNSCVTGRVEEVAVPTTGSEITVLEDASFKQVVDSLSGDLSGGINLPAVQASAGRRSLAKDITKTELSTNIVVIYTLAGKAKRISSTNRSIGEAGAYVTGNESKEGLCGTDFVSQIDYGASMAAAIEVTAKTAKDAQNIRGFLNVDALKIVHASGSLTKIDDTEAANYSIKVTLKQMGGRPQNLALAIPADGLHCSVRDMQTC